MTKIDTPQEWLDKQYAKYEKYVEEEYNNFMKNKYQKTDENYNWDAIALGLGVLAVTMNENNDHEMIYDCFDEEIIDECIVLINENIDNLDEDELAYCVECCNEFINEVEMVGSGIGYKPTIPKPEKPPKPVQNAYAKQIDAKTKSILKKDQPIQYADSGKGDMAKEFVKDQAKGFAKMGVGMVRNAIPIPNLNPVNAIKNKVANIKQNIINKEANKMQNKHDELNKKLENPNLTSYQKMEMRQKAANSMLNRGKYTTLFKRNKGVALNIAQQMRTGRNSDGDN